MPISKRLLGETVSALKPIWTQANEFALGIRTVSQPEDAQSRGSARPWWRGERSGSASHDDNFHYATIDYWNIRKVVQALKPGPTDVFYDIGSGMGRILCVIARTPVRKCVGIELIEPLCEIARANAAKLRGRRAPIEILCADATTADLSDGTIYFMFNPFGAETLRDVLENIRESVSKNPRTIRVVYYNPVFEPVLQQTGWLEKAGQMQAFGGHAITFWQSQHSPKPCES